MKKTLALLAACLMFAAPASADILAEWTFETSPPTTAGPHAADSGSGNALGFHAGSSTYSNPTGNGSTESFSSNTWAVGDYYQFSTSSVGYSGIEFSWDQAGSNTGPADFELSWSTDGTNFTSLLNHVVPSGSFSSVSVNALFQNGPVAAPSALDNQATIYFRLTNSSTLSINGGTVASGGTGRVDNVVITGVVPEPATIDLLSLGGLVVIRRRK